MLYYFVVEFEELVNRVETRLENASVVRRRTRTYSARNRLRRDMVKGHPVFELFVTGSSTGVATSFYCTICERDVSMESRGVGELARHFLGVRHWNRDITYRVHHDMPVFNRLMDPIELSTAQRDEYLARPCKEKPEGFSFPEDLLSSCTRVDSSVPLMTLVTCLLELLRAVGGYLLLRRLWGCFRATLVPDNPLYKLNWSRAESLVSCLFVSLSSC